MYNWITTQVVVATARQLNEFPLFFLVSLNLFLQVVRQGKTFVSARNCFDCETSEFHEWGVIRSKRQGIMDSHLYRLCSLRRQISAQWRVSRTRDKRGSVSNLIAIVLFEWVRCGAHHKWSTLLWFQWSWVTDGSGSYHIPAKVGTFPSFRELSFCLGGKRGCGEDLYRRVGSSGRLKTQPE